MLISFRLIYNLYCFFFIIWCRFVNYINVINIFSKCSNLFNFNSNWFYSAMTKWLLNSTTSYCLLSSNFDFPDNPNFFFSIAYLYHPVKFINYLVLIDCFWFFLFNNFWRLLRQLFFKPIFSCFHNNLISLINIL